LIISDGPLSLGLCGPSFRWLIGTQRPFPDVFAEAENGFIPPQICFVATRGTKHCRLAEETRQAVLGSAQGSK